MPHTTPSKEIANLFRRPVLRGAFALAATAIAAAPAPALADTFLKLNGIDGESVDARHKGEIEILSFTQSFINSYNPSGGGSGAGKVNCGAVTLTKNIDKSSPALLKNVISGRHIPDGVITFEANNRASSEYYTITMKEVFVTEVTQTDAADPNRIFEKLVLQASEYEFEYRPQTVKGEVGSPIKVAYNCKTSEVR
jgi:type VI secretion system secreted protein Hcp